MGHLRKETDKCVETKEIGQVEEKDVCWGDEKGGEKRPKEELMPLARGNDKGTILRNWRLFWQENGSCDSWFLVWGDLLAFNIYLTALSSITFEYTLSPF